MKRCPNCQRSYTDPSLNFCLEDGTPLVSDVPTPVDTNATVTYPPPRETSEPPPTEIYRPDSPLISQPPITASPPPSQQQWTPMPLAAAPKKKSNAIWWILGALAAFGIIGLGIVVMIIAITSMSNTNGNNNTTNVNVNRNENRNANVVTNANGTTPNANSTSSPASLIDDFSTQKWGTGESKFGRIWYSGNEYHMTSKDKTFIVMYAPTNAYDTENATVKVKARSVDGSSPSAGFGLMVHCAQSKTKQLEDYALLIYPSSEPAYEVIMHKDGTQTSLINKTPSSAIHSGSSTNELEIRIKGSEISFYVNGQYLNKITDTQNYKRGRAGFYTSDVTEVAFDDLVITH